MLWIVLVAGVALPAQLMAQRASRSVATDASIYLDPDARGLHRAAVAARDDLAAAVAGYTAVISRRMAASLRMPLKDRTLYRNEAAARVVWRREGPSLVQVLALREQTPAGVRRPEGLSANNLPDVPLDPAGDRLFFGFGERRGADDGDRFIIHPLGRDGADNYKFGSGDTLTLTLADGRRLRAVELRALPRREDPRLVAGSLWIEPGSGALVRAVYRMAGEFDVARDADDRDASDDIGRLPGLFRPVTFDVSLVVVEHSLWDFRVWLPRSMRLEGRLSAGVLHAPGTFELAYRMESVTLDPESADVAAGAVSDSAEARLSPQPPDSVSEADAGAVDPVLAADIDRLRSSDGLAYRLSENVTEWEGRPLRIMLPENPDELARSPHLPPPVWDEEAGFPSKAEIESARARLFRMPPPDSGRTHWAVISPLDRPDLIRYNRVEGPAVGMRFQWRGGSPFGPLALSAEPFVGFADREPKLRIGVSREAFRYRATLGGFSEMRSASRWENHLGLGNSLGALLFGRDDGDYYRATGVDLAVAPPAARRPAWSVRIYAERHDALSNGTHFSLADAFDEGAAFRPNIAASEHDETGAELRIAPWWGSDPLAPQGGGDLYVQGALGDRRHARVDLVLRVAIPFRIGGRARWAVAGEIAAGEAWGDVPPQRLHFLGGPHTLRGYAASVRSGPAFARARMEVARVFPTISLALFTDAGWAGGGLPELDRDEALASIGLGASVLDGLLRLDVARGLRAPVGTRWDFYLDAPY